MRKKFIAILLTLTTLTGFVGCSNDSIQDKDSKVYKAGLVTSFGNVTDKGFNQDTWEGLVDAESKYGIYVSYLKPVAEETQDYMDEIDNLYNAGYRTFVLPGFQLSNAAYHAQAKYEDAKFILLDTSATDDDGNEVLGKNSISVNFAEQEAGYLVGIAAALELKEANVGFVGGIEVPTSQRFSWGFQQAIQYANENLGTNITMEKENFVYAGSFADIPAGTKIANDMYDRGVDLIFAAAGGTGVGVFDEAVRRKQKGEDVWVIGVDTDQYDLGIYEEGKSVVLTSAVKKLSKAAVDLIEDDLNGEFKGGESLIFSVKEDCVGIPKENPNLSKETIDAVNKVLEDIKNGKIVVSSVQGDLIP